MKCHTQIFLWQWQLALTLILGHFTISFFALGAKIPNTGLIKVLKKLICSCTFLNRCPREIPLKDVKNVEQVLLKSMV